VQHAALSSKARKQELAGRLLTEIGLLLDQLHEPSVERKVVTLPGKILLQLDDEGEPYLASAWTVAEVQRDRPTVAEQKSIMVTAAIAVDKVQVLTGGATHRVAFEGQADREVRRSRRRPSTWRLAGRPADILGRPKPIRWMFGAPFGVLASANRLEPPCASERVNDGWRGSCSPHRLRACEGPL
jgi:hypothetical protein